MNWLDRIENINLEIITGDGESYFPLWKQAEKQVAYNVQTYDFAGVEGSYVDRKLRKAYKYPLTLWFQGENHIDEANKFLLSSENPKEWTIKHPIYDNLYVQPLEFTIDNSLMNVTKITGTVVETLTSKYPQAKINNVHKIKTAKVDIDEKTKVYFDENLSTKSIESAENTVQNISNNYTQYIETKKDIEKYKNYLRVASQSAQGVANDIISYVNDIQNLINFPFQIWQSVQGRVQSVIDSVNNLQINIFDSKDDKKLFEINQTGFLSAVCNCAANPKQDSDYKTRNQVYDIVNEIVDGYNYVLKMFDDSEHEQNSDLAQKLDYIVNLTVGQLYEIALNSKQERTINLECDNNIINLTQRFYGFSSENLNDFIEQNDISLQEYICIKKGREIKYYV